jgi:hypothetical protein
MTGLQVLGDLLELFQWRARPIGKCVHGVFQAVIDVILNKRSLGLTHRFLNGVQLLGDIHAGPLIFDHGDDAAQMTLGLFEPLNNRIMSLVRVRVRVRMRV